MILLSAVGYGSYGVWSRLMGHEFGIFYQGWVRSLIILCILIPIALITKSFKPVRKEDIKWLIIPVAFGVFCSAPIYYAFNHMDIGTATLIFYSLFIITNYSIGNLFLGEVITRYKLLSLFLSIIGLLFIFGFSLANFSLLALLMAVLNGIASGGEVATTKKTSHTYPSLQLAIYVWAGTFITNLPMSLLVGEKQILPSVDTAWIAMSAFALIGLAAFWLVVEGFRYVDASIGSLIGLLEIISSVIFGIFLFKEQLTLSVIVGGGIIFLAAMLPDLAALLSNSRKNKPIPLEAPVI